MAINHISFFSDQLQMMTSMNVILPDHPNGQGDVLLLLHGLGDDEHAWIAQTNLVDYAKKTQTTIIMPRAERSYYTNAQNGKKYGDFVGEEVLQRCQKWFHLPNDRTRTFIAGNSMGGFGALKFGLSYSETFSKLFALSAMPDIKASWQANPDRDAWLQSLFGSPDQVTNSTNDIGYLIAQQQNNAPEIWQFCGREDPFFAMNDRLAQQIETKRLRHTFVTVPGGHEWRLWDQAIDRILKMIATHERQNVIL